MIIELQGYFIVVEPTVLTVCVPVSIGDGCFNDSWEDREGYRAVLGNSVSTALTAEEAALRVLRAVQATAVLTVRDWIGATEDAIHLLRKAKVELIRECHPRTFAEAQRIAGLDVLCRRIARTIEGLDTEREGLCYLQLDRPLREVLDAIYDTERA